MSDDHHERLADREADRLYDQQRIAQLEARLAQAEARIAALEKQLRAPWNPTPTLQVFPEPPYKVTCVSNSQQEFHTPFMQSLTPAEQ